MGQIHYRTPPRARQTVPKYERYAKQESPFGQEQTSATKEKPGARPGSSLLVIRLGVLAPPAEAESQETKAE